MFSFFKNTKEKAPETHPFYGARISVDNREIRQYMHNDSHIESIEIDKIDFISIYCFDKFDENKRCWLTFTSYSSAEVGVTTLAGNFQELENFVLQLEDFDTKTYFEIKNSDAEISKKILWEKKSKSDFEIEKQSEKANFDLKNGIFLENFKTLVPWETYNELEKNKIISRKNVSFPNPIFSGYSYNIKSPTIFGGLKLTNLYTECDAFEAKPRLELPVIKYISEIKLGFFNPKKEYLKIKNHLEVHFSQKATARYGEDFNEELKDSLYAIWGFNKVLVTFYCFYREENNKFDTNSWLNIEYYPNVDRFFESDYQKNLEIHKYLDYEAFPFEVDLSANYREMTNVIFTPKCFENVFQNDNQFLIWNDIQEGVTGFATAKYARIFKANSFKSVSLGKDDYGDCEGQNAIRVDDIYLGNLSSFKSKLFENNIKKMQKLTNKEFFSFDEDPNRWR